MRGAGSGLLGTAVAAVAVAVLVAGCGGEVPPRAVPAAPAPSAGASSAASTVPSAPAPPGTTGPAGPAGTTGPSGGVAGRTVVLDPGHNGGNAANPAAVNRQVPAGRGRTKPCNTTGAATNAGYPEHAFNWDVAQRVRDLLVAQGVRVLMTRADDTGVGPCVDRRAAVGNAPEVDAVVSIHADGSSPQARGFHVAYSDPPVNAAQGEPARSLATAVRDAMRGAGFRDADYIGSAGLDGRDDLAGLNLAERPAVLVECANLRNPAEAAVVSTPEGRARYAAAIADGIVRWLGTR